MLNPINHAHFVAGGGTAVLCPRQPAVPVPITIAASAQPRSLYFCVKLINFQSSPRSRRFSLLLYSQSFTVLRSIPGDLCAVNLCAGPMAYAELHHPAPALLWSLRPPTSTSRDLPGSSRAVRVGLSLGSVCSFGLQAFLPFS